MPDKRNIQLGAGYLSVEGRGGVGVISDAAKKVERVPEKHFTFRAQICDSAEELQRNFSAAMSVSASAHGADLGAKASVSQATDATHFDAYYMMELEFREDCASLNSLREIFEILDPSIRQELESLDTVEKWEEFYRTKGSHIINSVTYGRKLIIIVSLNHKVQSEQLRRMLEAKAGFPGAAKVEIDLESSLKALAEENIASVQIHSIGDSNPNFLADIDKLAALKDRIQGFVNPVPKLQSETNIPEKSTEEAMPQLRSTETPRGVVIDYTTCPYIDFLNKQASHRQPIEMAYEKMLQATNRSSRYLEEIARCHGRLDTLLRSVDFYLTGHDGAFIMDHTTEKAARDLRESLRKHTNTLRDIARDVVAETTGLSEDGRRRRSLRLEAKECLGLRDDITANLSTCSLEDAQALISSRLSLIEKFEIGLNENGGGGLGLKQRLIDVQTVLDETEAQKKTYLPLLKSLRASFDSEVVPYLKKQKTLVEQLLITYQKLNNVLADGVAGTPISEEEKNLLEHLLEFVKQAVDQKAARDPWFTKLASFYEEMVTDVKPILVESALQTCPKKSLARGRLQEYFDPLVELLTDCLHSGEQVHQRESFHASSNISDSVSRELDSIIPLLMTLNASDFEQFNTITEACIALKKRVDTEPQEARDKLSSVLEACRLKPSEMVLLQKNIDQYIKKIDKQESSDAWWQARWAQIVQVSQDLDNITNNQKSSKLPDNISEIFTAIDFKREAYLVGKLPVKRGWGLRNNEFNGSHYQKIKVPSSLRFLRFKLAGEQEADKLSELPAEFSLQSKRKIDIAERKSAHRTLYKKKHTLDPIYPLQPHMRTIAKLFANKSKTDTALRGEELMHSRNETAMYRQVRIRGLSSEGIAKNRRKMSVLMYAQLGKELDNLALPKEAPKGVADYGVRVRTIDAMDTTISQRQEYQRAEVTVYRELQTTSVASLTPWAIERKTRIKRRPSFFEEQPSQLIVQQMPLVQRVESIEEVQTVVHEETQRSIFRQSSPVERAKSVELEPVHLPEENNLSATPLS